MSLRHISHLLFILFIAISCDTDKDNRMDDFLLDFATVQKSSGSTSFVLDNYRSLVPKIEPSKEWDEGQRVVINYTFLSGDTIKVNSVSEIYIGQIKSLYGVDDIQTEPIKIQSVWVGGNHLNLIFNVEYYDKAHKIELIHDTSKESDISLYLSYSREDDVPGYSQKMYTSFYLGDIQSEEVEDTPFKLYINTTSGLMTYNFKVTSKR